MRNRRSNSPAVVDASGGDGRAAGAATRQICRTNLQPDEPALDDAFGEFGSHQRIAEAIAELIRLEKKSGISIGVEGSWGAGKTTVARLLRKMLAGDKNISVFTFDAWAHEGDPLRRTFIESIIRHLQHQEWVKEKQTWDERVEEMANRREIVSTRDTVTLSGWGKALALSLLLVPAGGTFLTAALREDFTLAPTGTLASKFLLLFIAGLFLSLTPFLIILFTLRNKDVLGLLINKGSTEKRTETVKTANPTSIEFEKTFDSLMREALGAEGRRFVLILDNLDRVNPKDALAIWSTLQTFLQHKSDEQHPWCRRLWILVLYDRAGLHSLWQRGEGDGHVATSFMDKSFQIRFEVPALVLSDWREFLMKRLKESFPGHTEPEFHDVYRVLAIHLSKKNRFPTIREMKLYVNQIGSVHRQWAAGERRKNGGVHQSDAFPLSHIAYYVLLRREGEDVLDKLSKQEIPSREYQDLLGSEVAHNLAAIGFNVDVDEAQQLLFSNRIKDALGRGSSAELKRIASLPKGFWEMLEKFITTEWVGAETTKVADAALALNESELLGKAPQPAEQTVIRKMCDIASSIERWAALDERTAHGLSVLIRWKSNLEHDPEKFEGFLVTLFRAVALGLIDDAMRSDAPLDPRRWLDHLAVPIDRLQPNPKMRALQTVVGTVDSWIRATPGPDSRSLEPLLEVLSELNHSHPGSAAGSLTSLINEGRVAELLRQDESRTGASVAWGLYLLFRYAPGLDDRPTPAGGVGAWREVISAASDDPSGAVVEKFVKILERYQRLDLLFGVHARLPDVEPFTIQALRIVLKSPDAYSIFLGRDASHKLDYAFKVMGRSEDEVKTLDALTTRLLEEKVVDVNNLIYSSFEKRSARLYRHALRNSEGHDNGKFKQWCLNGFRQVTIEEWEGQLASGGDLLSLALALKRAGMPVNLGHNYFEALANKAREILEDADSDFRPAFRENMAELLGPVDGRARADLNRLLLEGQLDKMDGRIRPAFFKFMGAELREQLMYGQAPEQVLSLFPPILKERNLAGLVWIRDALAPPGPRVLDRYAEDARIKEFKEGVRAVVAGRWPDLRLKEKEEVRTIIRDIAELMETNPRRDD